MRVTYVRPLAAQHAVERSDWFKVTQVFCNFPDFESA